MLLEIAVLAGLALLTVALWVASTLEMMWNGTRPAVELSLAGFAAVSLLAWVIDCIHVIWASC